MTFNHLNLLESAGWPALLVDATGGICGVNKAACSFFGNRLPSLRLSDIWTIEEAADKWLARWKNSPAGVMALKFRCHDGRVLPFSAALCLASGDERQLFLLQLFPETAVPLAQTLPIPPPTGETDLAQKQKLDFALHLTRTVALDFNNALTTILGHTSYVLDKMEANNPWRISLSEVERAAEKAAEIAYQLALFSLEDKSKRSHTAGNMNALLRRVMPAFQTPEREKLLWSLQFESRLFTANYDEGKLQQALVKILENAVEALDSRGQIQVITRNLQLTEPTQDRTAQLTAGTYVCLEIKDDGPGIPPENLQRVFEPFFTTKYGHRGLGLAWVYGIVTNHGGGVAISSTSGQGTSVRVYLPATQKTIDERMVRDESLTGKETVLFVDDEEMVTKLAQLVLASAGYRVMTAHNGEDALEVFARTNTAIHLLVTDMVMPHMNGRELIEKVRALSPSTRSICTTACVRTLQCQEDLNYLQKPFTSQGLLRKVKQALEAPGAS